MEEKHKKYLDIALSVSKLSKCSKYKVGTVIVKNNKIVTTSVNGTAKGFTNCCDHFKGKDMTCKHVRDEHSKWSAIYEIHSEQMAIINAKCDLVGATLYCTLEPCFNCLKSIVGAGIKEIYFSDKYKDQLNSIEGQAFVNQLGVKIKQII